MSYNKSNDPRSTNLSCAVLIQPRPDHGSKRRFFGWGKPFGVESVPVMQRQDFFQEIGGSHILMLLMNVAHPMEKGFPGGAGIAHLVQLFFNQIKIRIPSGFVNWCGVFGFRDFLTRNPLSRIYPSAQNDEQRNEKPSEMFGQASFSFLPTPLGKFKRPRTNRSSFIKITLPQVKF